jgi:hypothetical protein
MTESSSELAEVLTDTAEALEVLVRLGRSEADLNQVALVVTNPLRLKLALYDDVDLPHDPVRGRTVAAELLSEATAGPRTVGVNEVATLFGAVAYELSGETPR